MTDWWTYDLCPVCRQQLGRPCRRVYMGRLGRQPLVNAHRGRPRIWDRRKPNQP